MVPSEDEFQSAVGMLKLLGDETRLRIIWALLDGEHSVNELAALVAAHPTGVSQHLAKLRLARLVRTRRDGTRIYYVADDAHVRRLVEEVLSHADHVTRSLANTLLTCPTHTAAQPDRLSRSRIRVRRDTSWERSTARATPSQKLLP